MKAVLAICLLSLALASAQPAKSAKSALPDKSCFENRPEVRPSECCTGLSSMIDESSLTACKAKYPETKPETEDAATEKSPRGRRGNSCIIECYMNQTAMFKNGAVDKTTAVTVLGKSLDANMKTVLSAAVDTCLAMHEAFKNKFSGKDHSKAPKGEKSQKQGEKGEKQGKRESRPKSPCGHTASFFVKCVEMEMYKNCPANKKVTSDNCTALTTYMDKCKIEKKN